MAHSMLDWRCRGGRAFSVYNMASAALLYGPADGSTLWQGFGGPCETENSGDPIALRQGRRALGPLSEWAESKNFRGCPLQREAGETCSKHRVTRLMRVNPGHTKPHSCL